MNVEHGTASTAEPIAALIDALGTGRARIVDLTHPLSERTPTMKAAAGSAQSPPMTRIELNHYDARGPYWRMHSMELGEHLGTHLDAPINWVTGKDKGDLASILPQRLIGPAVVIDKREEVEADPDFLLEVDDIQAFEREHGAPPAGSWLLLRTGWETRALDGPAFINEFDGRSHTPGLSSACARWLAEESQYVGLGVETVGADAGSAGLFDPPWPTHHYMLGAGKHTLCQVANLGELPPTGALLIVAPMKLVDGTGSPTRAFALVPGDAA